MVTVEKSKDILFSLEYCVLSKFIELVSNLLPLPPQIIKFKKTNNEILKFNPTKTFPLLKSGDIFISGTLPILKYLINSEKDDSDGVILDNRKILIGKNLKEEAKVEMWTNFIFTSIYPITFEIEGQLYGKKKFNSEIFNYAVNDLIEALKPVNEELTINAFLTSNNIRLPDLMLVSVLFKCYNDILTKEKMEKIPNVIRVFKFVSHMRNFVDIFGEAIPCEKQKEPEIFVESKEEELEKSIKNDKKDRKNKEHQKESEKEQNKEKDKEEGKKKKNKKNK